MKIYALVLATLMSAPALALNCNNQKLGEDSYLSVEVIEGQVSITMHETTIFATAKDLVASGDTLAILDKPLATTSEGEESVTQVSALLAWDKSGHTLTLTLILDDQVQEAATSLVCL